MSKRVIKVGLVGGIGAGKDTVANVICGVINGFTNYLVSSDDLSSVAVFGQLQTAALPSPQLRVAGNFKCAALLHFAASMAGFQVNDRVAKEKPAYVEVANITYAVNAILAYIFNTLDLDSHQDAYNAAAASFHRYINSHRVDGAIAMYRLSYRQFTQALGQWAKSYFGVDTLWVDVAHTQIDSGVCPELRVAVFSDIRFQFEADTMDVVVYIKSDRALPSTHISEDYAANFNPLNAAHVIVNNKDTPLHELIVEASTLAIGLYSAIAKSNNQYRGI